MKAKITAFMQKFLFACAVAALPILGMTSNASVQSSGWTPKKGDRIEINVDKNMGYLVHEDGSFLHFKVATGRKHFVYYIGRYYHASTPRETWKITQKDTLKYDRITFADHGTFFRLFRNDGQTRTSYGFHSTSNIDWMLKQPAKDRNYSMGCVLVSDDIIELIGKTFEVNGGEIEVKTY